LPLKIPPTKWGKPSNHQESVIWYTKCDINLWIFTLVIYGYS
jgi:hypothetical protein